MATSSTSGLSSDLVKSLNQQSELTKSTSKNQGEIGKNEFLTLLVTQLKQQDPLNPMENQEFAVQLAQFSSLEQLVQMNQKLGATESDSGQMAAYLGRLVSLKDDKVSVEGKDGGLVQVQLAADAENVSIELLNKDGSIASTVSAGTLSKGKYTIALDDVQATDGQYNYRVKATDAAGRAVGSKANVAGIVSGFVPGPEPKLLIGSREITPSDVTEVGIIGS